MPRFGGPTGQDSAPPQKSPQRNWMRLMGRVLAGSAASATATASSHPSRFAGAGVHSVLSQSTDAIGGDGVLAQATTSSPISMNASMPWTFPAMAEG